MTRLLPAMLLLAACVHSNTAPESTTPEPFQSTSLFDDDDDDNKSAIPTTETSPFADTSSTVTPTPEPQPEPPAPTTAPSNEPTTDRLQP